MSLKKNIIVLFLLIFVISSCKTIDRKIDNLSLEEEKNLSRLLGKQQIELIIGIAFKSNGLRTSILATREAKM